jgi:hypothetical protein
MPRKEVASGDPPANCAVCIAEVAMGEAVWVLPCRCAVTATTDKPVA